MDEERAAALLDARVALLQRELAALSEKRFSSGADYHAALRRAAVAEVTVPDEE